MVTCKQKRFRKSNYYICENGAVWNKKLKIFMKESTCRIGYKRVWLTISGIRKPYSVHRLVAECFILNKKNRPCVNHKDGDKSNNKRSNLEWCTHKENTNHAIKTGLISKRKPSLKGEMFFFLSTVFTQDEIAVTFETSQSNISQLIKSYSERENKR